MSIHTPVTPPAAIGQDLTNAIVAGLHREMEHIRQHARHQDWDVMLQAIDRLGAVAHAWHGHSPAHQAFISDFLTRELPLLRADLEGVQAELQTESRRIGHGRQQLQAVRGFRGGEPSLSPRLNVSA